MPKVKSIHHVAMVVADMQRSLGFWRDALGIGVRELLEVPAESSRIAFLPVAGAEVELVLPTLDDTGIARFLQKRGPGMHHICLEVDDLDGMLKQLKARGIKLVHEEAREGANGIRYAFVHPESTDGVLVELYQTQ